MGITSVWNLLQSYYKNNFKKLTKPIFGNSREFLRHVVIHLKVLFASTILLTGLKWQITSRIQWKQKLTYSKFKVSFYKKGMQEVGFANQSTLSTSSNKRGKTTSYL